MIGAHRTTISNDGGKTAVRYHYTDVVTFDNNTITLNTGGWPTATTKRRMNETSAEFSLGFNVYQKRSAWFVEYKGKTIKYPGDMLLLDRQKL